jgi:hypothetical protein
LNLQPFARAVLLAAPHERLLMPAELFPLACLLSGGRLGPEIAIAVLINVGGTVACAAGLRWALKDVPNVPSSVTAWPWEPEAWGLPPRGQQQQQAEAAKAAEGESGPAPAAADGADASPADEAQQQRAQAPARPKEE